MCLVCYNVRHKNDITQLRHNESIGAREQMLRKQYCLVDGALHTPMYKNKFSTVDSMETCKVRKTKMLLCRNIDTIYGFSFSLWRECAWTYSSCFHTRTLVHIFFIVWVKEKLLGIHDPIHGGRTTSCAFQLINENQFHPYNNWIYSFSLSQHLIRATYHPLFHCS